MSAETMKEISGLQAHQDVVSLHLGAQRVLESAHHGGEGRFIVNRVSPDLIDEIPGYLEGLVGKRFLKINVGDDGRVQSYGSCRINPQDAEFGVEKTWIDEETGEYRALCKWNHPPEEDTPSSRGGREKASSRRTDRVYKSLMAAIIATEAFGFGAFLKGHNEEARLRAAPTATIEEVERAEDLQELGVNIIGLTPLAAGALALGAVGNLVRQVSKENKKS